MRALLNENSVEKFNAKVLYSKVIDLFDEYNINQLTIQRVAEESLVRNQELREECFQQTKSDPTWKATVKSEKILIMYLILKTKSNILKRSLLMMRQLFSVTLLKKENLIRK